MEKGGKRFSQTSEKKNIIIVTASFYRYNLFNVGKWLLLKLHRRIALQSAQYSLFYRLVSGISICLLVAS